MTEIGYKTFYGCSALKSIDIPKSVTKIGGWAFRDCSSLECLDIPNSVSVIGEGAFWGCTSLKSIDIPDTVTKIEGWTFVDCTSLRRINLSDSVTKIGNWAFCGSSLETLIIPSSILEIGKGALCNCPISKISVDEDNPRFFSKDDVLYKNSEDGKIVLMKYAPKKRSKSFVVDENTIMLDDRAFEQAEELVEIHLHENISSLGNMDTFANCVSLKEICLPSKIKNIPKNAFDGCTSLEDVVLPNSENYTIETSIFKNCISLRSIHSAVKNIDNITVDKNAFEDFKEASYFDFHFLLSSISSSLSRTPPATLSSGKI